MIFFSALFFLLFSLSLSQTTRGLPNPTIIKDASDFFGNLFNSSHETITSVPPDFDILRSAKNLGDKIGTYTEDLLDDAATQYASLSNKIHEFKETVSRIATSAEEMGAILQDVDLEQFQNRLEMELSRAWESLKEEFSEPLPEDQTKRYQQQAIVISRALEMIEDGLVDVCNIWKIPEAEVRTKFGDIRPHLNHGLLVIVNLTNNHPDLLGVLLISTVLLIIPESGIIEPILHWRLLRPILQFFGFGTLGPVKGSIAASAQRLFFGGVVKKGSWFSTLQRIGMKILVEGRISYAPSNPLSGVNIVNYGQRTTIL